MALRLDLEFMSQDLFRSDHVGGLGEYPGFFLCLSLYFSLFVARIRCTSGPISTIYTSHSVFSRNDIPSGGFVDMNPHLGGKLKSPIKRKEGVNRHFQAKLQIKVK